MYVIVTLGPFNWPNRNFYASEVLMYRWRVSYLNFIHLTHSTSQLFTQIGKKGEYVSFLSDPSVGNTMFITSS